MEATAALFFLCLAAAGALLLVAMMMEAVRSFRQRRFDAAEDLDPKVLLSADPLPGEVGVQLPDGYEEARAAATTKMENDMMTAAVGKLQASGHTEHDVARVGLSLRNRFLAFVATTSTSVDKNL